jgi:hypothetical protein
MGLFSTLGGLAGSVFGGPIGGAIGGALGGFFESSQSVGQASQVQQQSTQQGIDEQRRQFDAVQKLLAPYVAAGAGGIAGMSPYQQAGAGALPTLQQYAQAGAPALEQQQAFLGLQGPEAERAAIARITGGETYKAMAQQGEEALLQRASATGGLRGGNIQAALGQFRPALLSSLIEQQYSRLGGLSNMGLNTQQNLASIGQSSAAGVGTAGMTTGANIGNLLGQQGAAQAGGILGQQSALTGGINRALGAVSGASGSGTSGLQAQFSQTPVGSSGFGSGMAYGEQDLGQYF